jgi:multidrug efflux pump subunit AcrA (membrane-fusion protein)
MKLRQDEPEPGTLEVDGDGRGPRRATPRPEPGHDGRPTLASRFREQPLLNGLLVVACIAVVVIGYTAVGPASQSSGQRTRTSTARYGVVQSTVSGSGNIQSADQLNLGFKTSGTVTHIYVKQGQHVTQGQLLATLDPQSAEVSLEQAKATLQSSEASLARLEENEGESTSGQGSGATASAASTSTIAYTTRGVTTTAGAESPTSTTPAATTPTTTTTPSTSPTGSTKPSTGQREKSKSNATKQASQVTEASPTSTPTGETSSSSGAKQSAATREANLASARAAVKSDKLAVQSAEQAVSNTKLNAPQSGTIVTLSGEVGETVSGTGTTRAAASSSSSSGSGSSATGGTGGKSSTGASSATSSSSSGAGNSSSSSFAVLSNLESLQLVVPLSESEIGSVHEGQVATVTIEALNSSKVAAHVASVSQVPTSSSGAVSYDVTFQLDQGAEGLKVGMSATAEVVVKQAEGVNVPTSTIKGGAVTVVRGGKEVTRRVTTGLAGDSSTIVLSGLNAGEEVVLPTLSTSSGAASLTSRLSRLGSRTGSLGGGGGFAGGGFPGGPPGG